MENHIHLLSTALKAAVLAGQDILEVYSREFHIELKEDKSPLTEADRKSHQRITAVLSDTGLPVLSEEGRDIPFAERSQWTKFWLVDPLDGTREFIKRNGEFTVNIALIINGEAVMGVIYAPVISALYFGGEEIGSYKTEAEPDFLLHMIHSHDIMHRLMETAVRIPLRNKERPFTVVASRSHMSDETASFIDSLRQTHGDLQMISKGSSLKLCLVAEGAADVYPRFAPTMEWDTAAGQAIARGAGYTVINPADNSPVIYNKENLLNPWFILR